MPEYAKICLNKQDCEYALGPKYSKYAKILNMAGSQYVSTTQHSEYARICVSRVLNISWVLNVPEFRIWQGSEYVKLYGVLNTPQCLNRTWICLNISEITIIDRALNIYHTVHSARSLYKLMSTYWEIDLFRTLSKI